LLVSTPNGVIWDHICRISSSQTSREDCVKIHQFHTFRKVGQLSISYKVFYNKL